MARLEREFRTTLLIRSTRRLQVTEAGNAFYARCARILKEAEDAFDELAETAAEPSGVLRLTAPFDYGIEVVVPAIAAFSTLYPQCKVQAHFNDRTLDLQSGDLDMAIRVGWLTQDHLQARLIGHFEQRLVAAPHWLDRQMRMESPDELADMPIIANLALREPTRWHFLSRDGAESIGVTMKASLLLDATLAVREASLSGAGLCVLPDYVIRADLAEGRLVEVLPDWHLPRGDIHAVFPTARFRPAKVRAFVEVLGRKVEG
ncbi:LysR family transcriptional regulator [Diaphorobacter aerolatus]|uniref:LysR family transcriptional regulator n=1 Tax=Diaphorobacter aerolatus TaxID=1288495 RepID=UPI00384AE03E